jgi:hypothetical protein
VSQFSNPYAPPQALDDAPQHSKSAWGRYFVISPLKLALLSLATFGIFEIVWLVKQWRAVREQTGQRCSPLFRGLFAIFFINKLFSYIRGEVQNAGIATGTSVGALTAVFIAGSVVSSIAGRIDVGPVWLVGFVTILPLVQMQKEINQLAVRESPDALQGLGDGVGAIVLLVLGAVWWCLVFVSFVLPTKS